MRKNKTMTAAVFLVAPLLAYAQQPQQATYRCTGNDGKKFYQNFHVIEASPEAAKSYLLENFPNSKLKPTIQITEIEEMEDAELFLPGVVYKSGKAYFNQDEPPKQ